MTATRRGPMTAATAVLSVLVLAPCVAQAKSASALPYPTGDVWGAAVRYLRVDRGFAIREKDEKAGYVLFDFTDSGKTFHASLELVALTEDDGRPSTEVVITLPDLPRRYEMLLLGELGAKVRQERGPAPAPKAKPAPAEPTKDREKDRDKDVPRPPEPDRGLPRAPTIPVP
jgi:hypothetical protein